MQENKSDPWINAPPIKPRSGKIVHAKHFIALIIYILNGLPFLIGAPFILLALMAFDAPGSTDEPKAYVPFAIIISYFFVYPLSTLISWRQLNEGKKIGWVIASIPFIYTIPTIIWRI